jgi:hypothetical protein
MSSTFYRFADEEFRLDSDVHIELVGDMAEGENKLQQEQVANGAAEKEVKTEPASTHLRRRLIGPIFRS